MSLNLDNKFTVPIRSIRQGMLRVTQLLKFSFRHLAEMTVTSIFFRQTIIFLRITTVNFPLKLNLSTYHILKNSHNSEYLKGGMNIPSEIQAEILPDKNLSVIDFLKFPLPAVSRSPITNLHAYLSPLSPTITSTNEIKNILPTPPPTVLDKLIQSPDVASSLAQSVLCPHAFGLTGE